MPSDHISQSRIRETTSRLRMDAEASGYFLNPDASFAEAIVEGLLLNERRYGYWACPCRLADGSIDNDRDIVCPCDYRDEDLLEWQACYCGLYVSRSVSDGSISLPSVPERRSPISTSVTGTGISAGLGLPGRAGLWRCPVCGYLCARPHPPAFCPICKATQDRFVPCTADFPSCRGSRQATKVAILLLSGLEDPFRLVHAFVWALDLADAGVSMSIIFEGKSPAWLPSLVDPTHPQHGLYHQVKAQNLIAGVCRACAAQAKVTAIAKREQLPLLEDASGHASLQPFVDRGAMIFAL